MKKIFLKSTIVVVAVAASSLGAWRAYDAYEVTDNSLLAENVEALTLTWEDITDPTISLFAGLASGKCGWDVEIRTCHWEIGNGKVSGNVDVYSSPLSGKLINFSTGQEYQFPTVNYTVTTTRSERITEGNWRVCEGAWSTCDRKKQILCDGTTDWYHDLKVPTNAVRN